MNKPYEEACQTKRAESPTEEAFNEIKITLNILSEAVERIACKTAEVRYSRPCDPGCEEDPCVPSCAPLVNRLRDIKNHICRNADNLNNLSDEIQL